jgi:quinoprotein glucose dehydrogenase
MKELNLPQLGGDSTFSGPLLTKTLLIYALTAGGRNDGPRLVAYDKATGRELASTDLPGAAIGTPMTYRLDGKQYIALTVQGATPRDIPEIVALALP